MPLEAWVAAGLTLSHALGLLCSFEALMSTRDGPGHGRLDRQPEPRAGPRGPGVRGVRAEPVPRLPDRAERPEGTLRGADRRRAGAVPPVPEPGDAPRPRGATRRSNWPTCRSSPGNTAELLIDGEATFASLFAGIDAAERYVLVQFYIVRDDGLGNALADRLIAAARRGVTVFMLYDEVGSRPGRAYWRRLRDAGVRVSEFGTTRGPRNRFQLNFRNHRKIVVADGAVGWVGGAQRRGRIRRPRPAVPRLAGHPHETDRPGRSAAPSLVSGRLALGRGGDPGAELVAGPRPGRDGRRRGLRADPPQRPGGPARNLRPDVPAGDRRGRGAAVDRQPLLRPGRGRRPRPAPRGPAGGGRAGADPQRGRLQAGRPGPVRVRRRPAGVRREGAAVRTRVHAPEGVSGRPEGRGGRDRESRQPVVPAELRGDGPRDRRRIFWRTSGRCWKPTSPAPGR